MIIKFPIKCIWGEIILSKRIENSLITDKISNEVQKNVFTILNRFTPANIRILKEDTEVVIIPELVDEDWLISKKVTNTQAKSCLAFHRVINSIPLDYNKDENNADLQSGIFFPISLEDFKNTIFKLESWAKNENSFNKIVSYLKDQGYIQSGGNYNIIAIDFPLLSNT